LQRVWKLRGKLRFGPFCIPDPASQRPYPANVRTPRLHDLISLTRKVGQGKPRHFLGVWGDVSDDESDGFFGAKIVLAQNP
jgi:hypothetical protein